MLSKNRNKLDAELAAGIGCVGSQLQRSAFSALSLG